VIDPTAPLRPLREGTTAIQMGDVVQLRRAHACGGDTWQIVRLGADIGARCLTCNRRVLMPRREFFRRVKTILPPAKTEDWGKRANSEAGQDS